MINIRFLGLVALSVVCTQPARAQDAGAGDRGSGISIAVTAGTIGIGPEIGYRISDHVGVRANAAFFGLSHDVEPEDVSYNGQLNLESYGAMLDVYPFGSHFRISGGARINKNRARVDGKPTSSVEVGENTYTPAQVGTLSGRGEVKDFAPALTLGWSGANRKGFMFGFDAGVLFQGGVRIREFTSSGSLANNAAFRADLEEERRSLQGDVDDYKIYPIAQFSIGWRL